MWNLVTNYTVESLALNVGGSLCDTNFGDTEKSRVPQTLIYQLHIAFGILTWGLFLLD